MAANKPLTSHGACMNYLGRTLIVVNGRLTSQLIVTTIKFPDTEDENAGILYWLRGEFMEIPVMLAVLKSTQIIFPE